MRSRENLESLLEIIKQTAKMICIKYNIEKSVRNDIISEAYLIYCELEKKGGFSIQELEVRLEFWVRGYCAGVRKTIPIEKAVDEPVFSFEYVSNKSLFNNLNKSDQGRVLEYIQSGLMKNPSKAYDVICYVLGFVPETIEEAEEGLGRLLSELCDGENAYPNIEEEPSNPIIH